MDAIALTAGQRADLLLLVAALEVEGAAIGARIHLVLAEADDVVAAGNFLPDGLARIQCVATLVDIAELHRLTDADLAPVRLVLSGDHAEKRRLAGAVRPDHADDAAGRKPEIEPVNEQAVAESLADAFGVDHVLAESFTRRNDDLRVARPAIGGRAHQFVIGLDTGLGFGLARFRAGGNPFALALQRLLARSFLAA